MSDLTDERKLQEILAAIDAKDATITALRSEVERAQNALREMQMAAGTAFNSLPDNQQDGVVGDFLAAIHRHCASALQGPRGPDEANAALETQEQT